MYTSTRQVNSLSSLNYRPQIHIFPANGLENYWNYTCEVQSKGRGTDVAVWRFTGYRVTVVSRVLIEFV